MAPIESGHMKIGSEDIAMLDEYAAQRGKKQHQQQLHLPPPPQQQQYYVDRRQYQPSKPHVYQVIVPVPATVKKEVGFVNCYEAGYMKIGSEDIAMLDEYVAQRGKKQHQQQSHLLPPPPQQQQYYVNKPQYQPSKPHVYQVIVPVPATVKKEVGFVNCYKAGHMKIESEDIAMLDEYAAQRGKKQHQQQPHLPPPPQQQQYYVNRPQYQPSKPHVYQVIVPVPATVKEVGFVDCYEAGPMKIGSEDIAMLDEYAAQRGQKQHRQQPHLPPPPQQQQYYANRHPYQPSKPHVY